MRETGAYKVVSPDWEAFCPKYLNMSRSEADKNIRLFQEFGEKYFTVAQFAPVSAETYRAIEPAIQEGAIHYKGEAIELIVENARQVSAVIGQLRRDTAETKKANVDDRKKLLALDKQCGRSSPNSRNSPAKATTRSTGNSSRPPWNECVPASPRSHGRTRCKASG